MGRRGARNVAGRHPAGIPSGLDGRRRVAIENVRPRVDGGRFAAKRVTGDVVEVTADVFADGHDAVAAVARHRHERDRSWREVAMRSLGNDRFQASFPVDRLGRYELAVAGWIDRFATWRHERERRLEAGQDVTAEPEVGARLVEEAAATTAAAARRPAAWPAPLRGAPDAAAAAA